MFGLIVAICESIRLLIFPNSIKNKYGNILDEIESKLNKRTKQGLKSNTILVTNCNKDAIHFAKIQSEIKEPNNVIFDLKVKILKGAPSDFAHVTYEEE